MQTHAGSMIGTLVSVRPQEPCIVASANQLLFKGGGLLEKLTVTLRTTEPVVRLKINEEALHLLTNSTEVERIK